MFDDTKPWAEKLTLFSDHITQVSELFMVERASPIYLPVEEKEPLKEEVLLLLRSVRQANLRKQTEMGIVVQTVLEQMTGCLKNLNET